MGSNISDVYLPDQLLNVSRNKTYKAAQSIFQFST